MGIMNGAKKGTPLDDEGRPVDVDLREMPQVKLPFEKSVPYVDFSFNDYPELLEDLRAGFEGTARGVGGRGHLPALSGACMKPKTTAASVTRCMPCPPARGGPAGLRATATAA